MPHVRDLHPDPVVAAIEVYWAPRQVLVRTLERWNGWASTDRLMAAYRASVDEPAKRDAVHQALSRLVRQGKVARIGTRMTARYRLAPGVTVAAAIQHRGRSAPSCAICGAVGAQTRGHAKGHASTRARRAA